MNDKKISYTISWTQPYTEYQLMQEAMLQMRVEASDMSEAKQVIDYIKGLK